MASTWMWIAVAAIVCLCIRGVSGTYTCGNGVTTTVFETCKVLPALGASLAWTLDSSSNSIHFAFSGAHLFPTPSPSTRFLSLIFSYSSLYILNFVLHVSSSCKSSIQVAGTTSYCVLLLFNGVKRTRTSGASFKNLFQPQDATWVSIRSKEKMKGAKLYMSRSSRKWNKCGNC